MVEVQPSGSTWLYWLIVGCEVIFWLVLLLSLCARYVLNRESVSRLLLISLPAVDLLLLVLTALDLKSGSPATTAHGLAAAYVGFTVAFGSMAVKWADQRFAHAFAGRAAPLKTPAVGWAAVRYEFQLWLRCILAWVITLAALGALIVYVNEDAVTQQLQLWYRIALGSAILWFIFGPGWSVLFFRRAAQ